VITREKGLNLVVHQFDWIYELARIADGAVPRRELPSVGPTGRSVSVDWISMTLCSDAPDYYRRQIAACIGSFGIYSPDMVEPLGQMYKGAEYVEDDRDEAVLYLGLIGTPEAASIVTEGADTPPFEDDDYLYGRGIFGLLLLDDVDLIAKQIRKSMPHSDLKAYAYGLAGSRDPRGRLLLEELRTDPNQRIRDAVAAALARPWARNPATPNAS
jgi:hypothetical protein